MAPVKLPDDLYGGELVCDHMDQQKLLHQDLCVVAQ